MLGLNLLDHCILIGIPIIVSYMFLISVYSGYSPGLYYGNTNVNRYLFPRIGFHFASLVARYNWNRISISYIQYSRGWFSSTSFRICDRISINAERYDSSELSSPSHPS